MDSKSSFPETIVPTAPPETITDCPSLPEQELQPTTTQNVTNLKESMPMDDAPPSYHTAIQCPENAPGTIPPASPSTLYTSNGFGHYPPNPYGTQPVVTSSTGAPYPTNPYGTQPVVTSSTLDGTPNTLPFNPYSGQTSGFVSASNGDQVNCQQQVPITIYSPPLSSCPVFTTCPVCRQNVQTKVEYLDGALTWLLCGVISLFGFVLGCCLIPFCTRSTKDVSHACPNCGNRFGVYRRL